MTEKKSDNRVKQGEKNRGTHQGGLKQTKNSPGNWLGHRGGNKKGGGPKKGGSYGNHSEVKKRVLTGGNNKFPSDL